jgi:hypothetical protein
MFAKMSLQNTSLHSVFSDKNHKYFNYFKICTHTIVLLYTEQYYNFTLLEILKGSDDGV